MDHDSGLIYLHIILSINEQTKRKKFFQNESVCRLTDLYFSSKYIVLMKPNTLASV